MSWFDDLGKYATWTNVGKFSQAVGRAPIGVTAKGALLLGAAAVAYLNEPPSAARERQEFASKTYDQVGTWMIATREWFGELTPLERQLAEKFMNGVQDKAVRKVVVKQKVVELTKKKLAIARQQALLRKRKQAIDAVRRQAKYQRKQQLKKLGKTLLKRGLRSMATHVSFHMVGSFAGTALAHSVDASNAADALQAWNDLTDAHGSVDSMMGSLDALSNFDDLDCMQSTYDALTNYNTFDLTGLDANQLDLMSDHATHALSILTDQNAGMEAAYAQYPDLFSSTAGVDPTLFAHHDTSALHFGGGSMSTDLLGPNGEKLDAGPLGYVLSTDPTVGVPATCTTYPPK